MNQPVPGARASVCTQQDRGDTVRVFGVLFVASAAASLGIGIILPVLPLYAESLGASGMMIGLIFSSFACAKVLVSPWCGAAADRWGKKPLIVGGLALFALVALGFVWSTRVAELVAIRCVMGVANALVVPAVAAYAGGLAVRDREAQFMAVFSLSLLVGMGLGPLLGGVISDRWGVKTAFGAMSVVAALTAVYAAVFLPSREVPTGAASGPGLKKLLALRPLRGIMGYRLADTAGMGGMMICLPLLLKTEGVGLSGVGLLVAMILCLGGILQVPCAWLVDKSGRYASAVAAGALLSMTALLGLTFAHGFGAFLLLGALSALGGALSGPALNALVVRQGRQVGLGLSMGSLDAAQAAGFIVGPLSAGLVMDVWGLGAVFVCAAFVCLTGLGYFLSTSGKM